MIVAFRRIGPYTSDSYPTIPDVYPVAQLGHRRIPQAMDGRAAERRGDPPCRTRARQPGGIRRRLRAAFRSRAGEVLGEFFVVVARLESDWNPHAFLKEKPPANDSVGLLQISYEDQSDYKLEPPDPEAKSLEDPLVNIRCAVRMIAHLLRQNGVVAGRSAGKWQGGARYWAVLRKPASRAEIQAYVEKQLAR